MKFDENPFRVLNVSIYDTKSTIIEQADDLSFADPDREKIIEAAKNILLNPRKRIAAEVRLFVDADAFSAENIFVELTEIDRMFSIQKPDILRTRINATRIKSKFPAVNDTETIKAELKNLRDELRGMMQEALKAVSHQTKVDFANRLVDKVLTQKNFGVVIEDFFDSYKLEMSAFIDDTVEQIIALSGKFEFNFKAEFSQYLYELEPKITAFVNTRRPVDKFYAALGTNKFDDSEEIFYAVREVAIKLYNEKHLIDYPLTITRMLEKNFSYLPKVDELIREDLKFLEDAKKNQPSPSFTTAMKQLEAIKKSMEHSLHFEKGFEQANLDFYLHFFRSTHEDTIKLLMFRRDMSLDEWHILNAATAAIYIQMGTAMTWVHFHPKTVLELFRKALPYAEASGNAELVVRIRKDVDEWERTNNRIYGKSSSEEWGCSEGCGCVWLIVWAFIVICSFLH
ncbi:MAG: hypothetical protein IJ685_09255 [Selenomonadaceae bacterium]|nr:hypothetical protein [Selenomonadaceae bacterium]